MNLDLKNYSTFKVGGEAYRILNLRSEMDIVSAIAYAEKCQKDFIVIGEGSNSIFSDEYDLFVIGHMQIKGINIKEDEEDYQTIRISAGESWDEIVAWSVDHNLSGIEALSGIPGTVGAAPIQNIGAYGTELSHVLINVSVYDIENKRFKTLPASDCGLSYRDSIFKQNPKKYVVTEITIKLSKNTPSIPDYASIKDKFTEANTTSAQIREVVLKTRNEKLPDYKVIPNCGSFFKNPIITKEQFIAIQKSNPDIPYFETESGEIKLYAGWLIEHIDYQTLESTHISFYEKNKLVLVNKGGASFRELTIVISKVKEEIKKIFEIDIEVEPNLFS
jgi:UDP-N-acetylmuramate dehydrogenase